MMLYCILTVFGAFLLYKDVRDEGCDPSGGVTNNESCSSTGADVFGAMLGKLKANNLSIGYVPFSFFLSLTSEITS